MKTAVKIKPNNLTSYCVAFVLPIVLGSLYWTNRPFADVLAEQSVDISNLTVGQKTNLELAAHRIDTITIDADNTFSFNRTVGPRTQQRGYSAEPAYLGHQTILSTGGGVCLLSSTIYKLALQSGLEIKQRTAHLRTIHSAEPGMDATVWYGRTDLRFTNTTNAPIKFICNSDGDSLKVKILGTENKETKCLLSTYQTHPNKDHLRVRVTRNMHGREELISDDLYGRSE